MAKASKKKVRRIRLSQVQFCEINVFSQPHSSESYLRAFHELAQQKPFVRYHGQRVVQIGSLHDLDDDRLPNAITGLFCVYSQINFDDPWGNTAKSEIATADELKGIKIPPNLAPEFRQYRYIFDPHRHRLFVETKTKSGNTLSPKLFRDALETMLQSLVPSLFQEVSAVVVPNSDAVDRVLKIPGMRKLQIVIKRPNPDDEDFELGVLADMGVENVGTFEQIKTKAPGTNGIVASQITKRLAKLAAKFGFVASWGKSVDGVPSSENTREHPAIHTVAFHDADDSLDKTVEFVAALGED